MLLNLPKEDYQNEIDVLTAKFQKVKLVADDSAVVELWVDVAEPQHIREAVTKNFAFAKEVDLKPYGGDYWILINGHLVEVIERKAGTDLAASIRNGSQDAIRFGKERFRSQIDKIGELTMFCTHRAVC